MNSSRQLLFGVVALAIQAGLAAAADPPPSQPWYPFVVAVVASNPPTSPAVPAPSQPVIVAAPVAPAPNLTTYPLSVAAVAANPTAPPAPSAPVNTAAPAPAPNPPPNAAAAPAPSSPANLLPPPRPAGPAGPSLAPQVPGAGPSWCNCCCLDCCHGTVLAGVGLYWIQPYFEHNMAFGVGQTTPTTTGTARSDVQAEIQHHMDVAPEVWLGYLTDDGFGGRARYWYFRQGTSQNEIATLNMGGPATFDAVSNAPLGLVVFAAAGQEMNVTSKLEVQVLDLEFLRDYHPGCWDVLLSGGLRLARLDQSYNAFVFTGSSLIDYVTSNHSFQGAGPVLAAEIRRSLGCCGLGLYGSVRGSILFGTETQAAFLFSQTSSASDHEDRAILTGELELGLEYSKRVCSTRLFGQVALVGQDWNGAGNASRASISVMPGGAFGLGAVVDSNIDFLGVVFRLGVNY